MSVINKSEARIKAENDFYILLDTFDSKKFNSSKYRNLFDSMSDKDFKLFMTRIANEDDFITINIDSSQRSITLDKIFEKCDKLGIETHKYVMYRENKSTDGTTSITPYKSLILYIPIKRLQQMVSKKNSASGDNDKINILTGAVTSDSKSGSLNNTQSLGLITSQQPNTLKELLGPRSDDPVSKNQMLQYIEETGEVSLDNLVIDVSNKQSISTLKVFLRSIGIELKTK